MRLSIPNSILLGLSLVAISIFASAYLYTDIRRDVGRYQSIFLGVDNATFFDTKHGCYITRYMKKKDNVFCVNYRHPY